MENHRRFLLDNLSHAEIKGTVDQQRAWSQRNKDDPVLCTKSVKIKKLFKRHQCCIKIPITPIGLPSLCWQNSRNTAIFDEKYKVQGGHEIMACPCGGRVNLVPHCVNYTIQNGKRKYYDFTRDYNDETYKYFLPDENLSHKAEMNEDPNERENIIEYGKIRCKCGLGEAYEPQ